jgi:hypothetical protein
MMHSPVNRAVKGLMPSIELFIQALGDDAVGLFLEKAAQT